jgi:hypothetical protein
MCYLELEQREPKYWLLASRRNLPMRMSSGCAGTDFQLAPWWAHLMPARLIWNDTPKLIDDVPPGACLTRTELLSFSPILFVVRYIF